MRRTGVRVCVQEIRHPPNFLSILAATPGCQNSTVLDLSRQTTGCPVLSSTLVDTGTGEVSLSVRSTRSRVLISLTVSDEDLEEDVEQ